MKLKTAIAALSLGLALILALSGCPKRDGGGGASIPKSGAWIIRQPGALHSMAEKDGVLSTKWLASLDIGSPVKLLEAEPRQMPFPGDSKALDFFHAEAGGVSGWIFSGYLASGLGLGVVIEEATALYKGPAYGDVTNDRLARLNIVVIQEVQGEFYRISTYDRDRSVSYAGTRWVLSTAVDNTEVAVESAKLLRKFQGTPLDQGNVKTELLKLLASKYAASPFSDLVAAESGKIAVARSGGAKVYSQGIMPAPEADAEEGGSPASVLVGSVKEGAGLVVEESGAADSIDGKDGLWYRVSAPLSGWVFGSQLEFAAAW